MKNETGSKNGSGIIMEYNSTPSMKRLATMPITPGNRETFTKSKGCDETFRRNKTADEFVANIVQGMFG